MVTRTPKNTITYCIRCGSTVHWNDEGMPQILKLGNSNLVACLEEGCNLLYTNVPATGCDVAGLDILRLAMVESGVPAEEARQAVLTLAVSNQEMPVL
jgi:hypothetical protein